MQIFVKTITGETITLVNVEETVDSVKERIAEIEGVPVAQQRLIYSGREMEDGRTLSFYNVQEDSTIHMMLALPGGRCLGPEWRLASYYVSRRKICRKCYGRLPANATRCRKVKCGRTSDIRIKRPFYRGQIFGPGWRLASYYVARKKICRKCYGRLPVNATRCRKVKCGRTSDIRIKRPYRKHDKRDYPKRLSEWYIPGFWRS